MGPRRLDAGPVNIGHRMASQVIPPNARGSAFSEGVTLILRRWTALQIALDQGLGSGNPNTDFADLHEETVGYFQRNGGDANAEDLAENFEMWFDQVFNLALEDGSALQVGRSLEQLYRQIVVEGNPATLLALRESQASVVGRQRAGTQIVGNNEEGLTVEDNSDDSDDDDDDEEDSDEEMGEAGPSSSSGGPKGKPEKIIDEDGFETVQSRRRR